MKSTFLRGVGYGVAAFVLAGGLAGSAFAGAGPPPVPTVPEIDPGSAVGALTLLVGGVMTLIDRRRSK